MSERDKGRDKRRGTERYKKVSPRSTYPVHKLIRDLESGLSSADIIAQQAAKHLDGDRSAMRGDESEERVLEVVSKLPFVLSVRRKGKGGRADAQGIDLLASMNEQYDSSSISIQVRSSQVGIDHMMKQLEKRTGLTRKGVEDWMKETGRVVLNGQEDPTQIRENFIRQLEEIKDHHTPS